MTGTRNSRPVVQRLGSRKRARPNRFARFVAFYIRDRERLDVRFVNHEEIIMREKIKERVPRRAGRTPELWRELFSMPNNPFLHHSRRIRACLIALCSINFLSRSNSMMRCAESLANGQDRAFHLSFVRDELFRRENDDGVERFNFVSVTAETRDAFFDFSPEKSMRIRLSRPADGLRWCRRARENVRARTYVVALVLQSMRRERKISRDNCSPARMGMIISS